MRRKTILVVLVLALLATFVAVGSGAKVVKATGRDATVMSADAVANLGGAYNNQCVWDAVAAGYKGKVNMIQPAGNVDVILGVSADNLIEGTYWVYLDLDGVPPFGPWSGTPIGAFTVGADDYGHGEFNYTLPAGTLSNGDYSWGIWINGPAGSCGTVLMTEAPIVFTIGD